VSKVTTFKIKFGVLLRVTEELCRTPYKIELPQQTLQQRSVHSEADKPSSLY
jgi:hypothetical protein